MFSKKPPQSHNSRDIRAFLEEGCEFEGKMTFSGVVRLNGKFRGEIHTKDLLIIGKTAHIEGVVEVGSIIVGGTIIGNITALDRIEIQPTGNIRGNITAPTLITQEGAKMIGEVTVGLARSQAVHEPIAEAS